MRIQTIHWDIIKRLLLGWVLLSLLIGSAVFYIELKKMDQLVLGLAVEESRFFTDELDRNSASRMELLKQKADQFLKKHFIVIELYDVNKKQVLREISPGKEAIEGKLEPYLQAFPMENAVHYDQFLMKQNSFLHVILPLRESDGELIGYFKGVYQVDAETRHKVEYDLLMTMLLVVVVIFATTLMLYPIIISLNKGLINISKDLALLSADLLNGNIEMMDVLGRAIAERDSDTNSHNYRVTIYSVRFAETLGLPAEKIRHLIAGAFLHDVGKIGIRDNILLKPGSLTDEELTVMRTHVLLGVDIISRSKWLAGAREVVEFHHEKFDGSGYMQGLQGDAIPLNARIFTIVDVFDALTSRRPYKEPFDFNESMKIMKTEAGKRFDPELFQLFSERVFNIHQEIVHASDAVLESMLAALVRKHFLGK